MLGQIAAAMDRIDKFIISEKGLFVADMKFRVRDTALAAHGHQLDLRVIDQ